MSSTPSLTRSRYIRLMAISAADILGTIPLGTFYIVHSTKIGVKPWRGWTYTHEHYSDVIQVPDSIWKNNPNSVLVLEMFRWSLVLCALVFFALFGFANEARKNYRRVYTSIVSRIGISTLTFHKSSHKYVVHLPCGTAPVHRGSNLLFSCQCFISSFREEQLRCHGLCGCNG
jgi:pheromone a factor receptor